MTELTLPKQRNWLRIESLTIAGTSSMLYFLSGASIVLFLVLILVPDLSMLGYLKGKRTGAATYNVAHTYATPIVLLGIGVLLNFGLATALALIWIVHIAVDRALGYGLKSPEGFGTTHLGRIGKGKA